MACQIFDPIGFSTAPEGGKTIPDEFNRFDTDLTVRDIGEHNRKWDELCKGTKK